MTIEAFGPNENTCLRFNDSNWDDTFEVGDVIAVEPAVYADDELRAGIRLENNYLVTETGVELLSDFPLGL